jgi:hypothetical protein
MGAIVHALLPIAVVVCATVLGALHVIDSTTCVTLIGAAAGIGAVAVKSGTKGS